MLKQEVHAILRPRHTLYFTQSNSFCSVYKYSYVKSTVSVNQIAKDMTKQRREQGTLGDHEYCFAVETVFVPENDAALAWNMAGNTDLYQGNDPKVPEGAFQKSNCCVIAKLDGEWKMTYIGTSW